MKLDRPTAPSPYDLLPPVPAFELSSADVRTGERLAETFVFNGWGVHGSNLSPQLSWSRFPVATRSFVVTLFDPDAPTASGFWHWVVVNVPRTVTSLARDSGARGSKGLPSGAFHIANDFGEANYCGAAPPAGDRPHRYCYAVHAVDVENLGVEPAARPAVVGFNLTFHTLARALLVPVYGV